MTCPFPRRCVASARTRGSGPLCGTTTRVPDHPTGELRVSLAGHRRLRPGARPRPGHRRADAGPAGAADRRAGPARLGRARPAVSGRAALARAGAVRPGDRPGGSDPAASGPGGGPAVAVRARSPPDDDDERDRRRFARPHTARYAARCRRPRQTGPEQAPLPLFTDGHGGRGRGRVTPGARRGRGRGLEHAGVRRARGPRGETLPGARSGPAGTARRRVAWPAWRTSGWYADTRPLARQITETGDLRPVRDLLGALTEAGCDHPTVLDALSEPLVPLEACWMVETLAGAEPGTLLRHHV